MDDFPWVPIAMVIIAFISWVSNQLKQAAEVRRVRMEQRQAKARARAEAQPAPKAEAPSPYRPISESPAPPPLPNPVPKTFRELLENVERAIHAPPPEPVAPPPIPVPPAPVIATPLVAVVSKPVVPRVPRSSLSRILRNQESLRQSIILKEILDPPVSLR